MILPVTLRRALRATIASEKKKQKTINPHSYPRRGTTEGGGGVEPLPGVFDIFLILPLVQSQF